MDNIKISDLTKEDTVIVYGGSTPLILSAQEILDNIEYYKYREVYLAKVCKVQFNVENILDLLIEYESEKCSMDEDWIDNIYSDITSEDKIELQMIFDKILARNKSQNTSIHCDKKIDFS